MTKDSADNLLTRWGAWSRHSIWIGAASENIIYKMMMDSAGAAHTQINAGIPQAKDIEQADAIIAKFRKGTKKAVKMYYIARLPAQLAAQKCRCGEDEFMRRINYAIDIIAMEM